MFVHACMHAGMHVHISLLLPFLPVGDLCSKIVIMNKKKANVRMSAQIKVVKT